MSEASPIDSHTDGNLRKTEGATVFIEWDIEHYKSLFEQRKFGALAKSPTFDVRNSTWSFQISHLLSTLGEKLVVVYLFRHAFETRYQSVSHLVVVQINEKEICGGYRKTCVFGKIDKFCSIVAREKDLLHRMTSDAVTVLCTFFPEAEEQKSETLSTALANEEGIDILSSHIKELFLNGENSDFVMKVKGKVFQVHKAILSARSPVLSAMLQHDMAEKHSSSTEIVDCEPEVFEQFLHYLYSGRLDEISWDSVISLYCLGDKYDLCHLRKVCLDFMADNLCIDAFCDAISLAVKHNELALLGVAEDFFHENVKSILMTNRWQLLLRENPVICNELFLKCYE